VLIMPPEEVTMNKGSHISLALFLLDREELKELNLHKRAFLIGSILPDCIPSFLITRHTIVETFSLLQTEFKRLTDNYNKERGISNYFCMHLGMIMHYLADYFTTPHNPGFVGTVKKHVEYEKELLVSIQRYFEEGAVILDKNGLDESQQRCEYILQAHYNYLNEPRELTTDCKYITNICYTVAQELVKQLIGSAITERTMQEIAA